MLPGSEAEEEEEKVPSEHNTETELVSGVSSPDLEVTLCRAVTCHFLCVLRFGVIGVHHVYIILCVIRV